MTSKSPITLPPLPPIKVGDKIEVKVDFINTTDKSGATEIDDWMLIIEHTKDKEELRIGENVKVVITEISPGFAHGTQI